MGHAIELVAAFRMMLIQRTKANICTACAEAIYASIQANALMCTRIHVYIIRPSDLAELKLNEDTRKSK